MENFKSLFIGVFMLLSCNPREKTDVVQKEDQVEPKKLALTYSQDKVSSMVRYMHQKEKFDASGKSNDILIKQVLVDLTSDRSVTVPEIPKLHLVTGVLFNDLGKEKKALEYYELEIKMADLSEKTGLEEALKQNWRRSKIEALILMDQSTRLKGYMANLKRNLEWRYYKELYECSKFRREDVYASYSLKIVRNKDMGVVLL